MKHELIRTSVVRRSPLLRLTALLVCALSGAAFAGESDCGPLTNHVGPWDYNTASREQRLIVDRVHFTSGVEQLKQRATGAFGHDIGYTLGVFPNHARALLTMSNLALREKTARPLGSRHTVDCWFDRAFRFRPTNGDTRMIYGIYLLKVGRTKEAVDNLKTAAELAGDNANVHYNLGLAYFDLKEFDKSLDHAHRAYLLGFELPGLKTKLERAGKWREAPPPKLENADAPATPDTVPAAAPVAEPAPDAAR